MLATPIDEVGRLQDQNGRVLLDLIANLGDDFHTLPVISVLTSTSAMRDYPFESNGSTILPDVSCCNRYYYLSSYNAWGPDILGCSPPRMADLFELCISRPSTGRPQNPFQKLAIDPGGTPQRVFQARPMPAQDGLRLHDLSQHKQLRAKAGHPDQYGPIAS